MSAKVEKISNEKGNRSDSDLAGTTPNRRKLQSNEAIRFLSYRPPGSYVATFFSLFHAQKRLGHFTSAVISADYASLTDLPNLQPARMGQAP